MRRALRPGRARGRAILTPAAIVLAAVALLAGVRVAAAPATDSVAQSALTTTGPVPPATVKAPSGGRSAVAAAGETIVAGVPAYIWRDGCAPTSVGMVVGFYDGHGFPDLVAGDAGTQTTAASQMIASHGSAGDPRHYEDYSLPKETDGTILADKSATPPGDEHASDSVADFMHTSWSAEGLAYGWSYTNMVGPAFDGYVRSRLVDVATSCRNLYYGSSLTFAALQQEIDAGRPLVLSVDCTGDGVTDHAVVGIGYRETSGYPEYACWDTWYSTVRWQQFRGLSSSYAWGVSGATALTLWAHDQTAPVTIVSGSDSSWHRSAVKLTFSATDKSSGADFVEIDLDGAGWAPLPGLPGDLLVSGQGVHTVSYRSTDHEGNREDARTCRVRIDAGRPVTRARAASVRRGARARLRYRVADLTPRARVRIVIRTLSGQPRKTLRLGSRGTNALRSASWRCTLPRGAYRFFVYATDQAGNHQAKAGAARLTVR